MRSTNRSRWSTSKTVLAPLSRTSRRHPYGPDHIRRRNAPFPKEVPSAHESKSAEMTRVQARTSVMISAATESPDYGKRVWRAAEGVRDCTMHMHT